MEKLPAVGTIRLDTVFWMLMIVNRRTRNRVALLDPRAEINHLAALRAEWPKRITGAGFRGSFAGRATHRRGPKAESSWVRPLVDLAVALITAARRAERSRPMIIGHELAVAKLALVGTAVIDGDMGDQ